MNHLKLATGLTDYLYSNNYLGAEASEALFDLLVDAFSDRPEIASVIAADYLAKKEEWDELNEDEEDDRHLGGVEYE